jgi:hypothetical protein
MYAALLPQTRLSSGHTKMTDMNFYQGFRAESGGLVDNFSGRTVLGDWNFELLALKI